MEYNVGDVWEIQSRPDPHIIPPHIENIVVISARRLKPSQRIEEAIHRYMPPPAGGPEKLFDGFVQTAPSGALYIAERTGLPPRSTMFWVPDQPLELDCTGKRLHYRYPSRKGPQMLVFVGFQEPVKVLPTGTLLRVSLAHWWRPTDKPDEEQRCYVQLSGWFLNEPAGDWSADSLSASWRTPGRADKLSALQSPLPSRSLDDAREVLKRIFGYADFLPLQADVIGRVLEGKDALV